ncbi:MAG TPA: iron donor protein CyaY [Kofleriaceae bacterium]|nr:iron donor protein CyaY [Kofleriaceae bacterium]
MDDAAFDTIAHDEMVYLEERLGELDPDDVELTVSQGVLRLDLRDGTKIVVNSHRAARQIWMAAVATAWHFDPTGDGRWLATKTNEELRPTITRLLRERLGLAVQL